MRTGAGRWGRLGDRTTIQFTSVKCRLTVQQQPDGDIQNLVIQPSATGKRATKERLSSMTFHLLKRPRRLSPLECSTHSAAGKKKKKKVVRCQVAALLLLPHCSLQDDSPFSSPQPLAGTSHVTLFDPSTYTETIFLSPRRRRRRRSCLLSPVLGKKDGPPHLDNTDTHTIRAGLSERERACTSMTHHLFRSCLGFQVAGREAALVGCQSADCRSILSHTSAYVRTTGLLMPLCRYRRRHPG